MDIEQALIGMKNAQEKIRTAGAINNPTFLSSQMMRLSAYTAATEEYLAKYEKDLEIQEGQLLKQYMIDQHMKVSHAERMIDIEISELKGQIKYLTRLVKSAWGQVGVIQSRINHLNKEAGTQI